MFGRAVPLQMLLKGFSSGTVGVSSVNGVDDDVRTINNFVQFFPNSLGKSLVKNGVTDFVLLVDQVVLVEVFVVDVLVASTSLSSRSE